MQFEPNQFRKINKIYLFVFIGSVIGPSFFLAIIAAWMSGQGSGALGVAFAMVPFVYLVGAGVCLIPGSWITSALITRRIDKTSEIENLYIDKSALVGSPVPSIGQSLPESASLRGMVASLMLLSPLMLLLMTALTVVLNFTSYPFMNLFVILPTLGNFAAVVVTMQYWSRRINNKNSYYSKKFIVIITVIISGTSMFLPISAAVTQQQNQRVEHEAAHQKQLEKIASDGKKVAEEAERKRIELEKERYVKALVDYKMNPYTPKAGSDFAVSFEDGPIDAKQNEYTGITFFVLQSEQKKLRTTEYKFPYPEPINPSTGKCYLYHKGTTEKNNVFSDCILVGTSTSGIRIYTSDDPRIYKGKIYTCMFVKGGRLIKVFNRNGSGCNEIRALAEDLVETDLQSLINKYRSAVEKRNYSVSQD